MSFAEIFSVNSGNKMNCVLSDTKRFKQANHDNNIHNLDKFESVCTVLKQKGSLKQQIYDRTKPSAAVTPTVYGLPKINEEDCPCARFWLQLTATPMSAHHFPGKF